MNPRGKKVQEKMLPKVVDRKVMFARKATKVSIGGTEEQVCGNMKSDLTSSVFLR